MEAYAGSKENSGETEIGLIESVVGKLGYLGHFLHYHLGVRVGKQRVLIMILESDGDVLQKDLQKKLCVQSGSISELIIRMETEGLLQKLRSETDSRSVVLRLTPEGRRQAEIFRQEGEEKLRQIMSCCSEPELLELGSRLDVLVRHWKQLENQMKME